MKILIICNRIPYPLKDGGAIAIYNMIHSMINLEHEVSLFSLNTNKHFIDPDSLPPLFKKLIHTCFVKIDTSISIKKAFINLFSNRSFIIERFENENIHDELRVFLTANKFDIIQIEGMTMLPYIPTIRKVSKAKITFRAHNLEHQIWDRLSENAKYVKRWYLKLLANQMLQQEKKMPALVDAIIPITIEDANFFKIHFPKTLLFTSPAGVDLNRFVPNLKAAETNTIFHIGALNWMPNQDSIIWFKDKVWPIITKANPQLKFYIAGKDTSESFLKWNYENIIVLGEVDSAIDFINSKSIMIVPLQSGSGMRLKVVEGMALKKAIVSTSIGAEGIEYTNKENILIADTPEDFANGILNLLINDAFRQKIEINARKLIELNYNQDKLVENLCLFYLNKVLTC